MPLTSKIPRVKLNLPFNSKANQSKAKLVNN